MNGGTLPFKPSTTRIQCPRVNAEWIDRLPSLMEVNLAIQRGRLPQYQMIGQVTKKYSSKEFYQESEKKKEEEEKKKYQIYFGRR